MEKKELTTLDEMISQATFYVPKGVESISLNDAKALAEEYKDIHCEALRKENEKIRRAFDILSDQCKKAVSEANELQEENERLKEYIEVYNEALEVYIPSSELDEVNEFVQTGIAKALNKEDK